MASALYAQIIPVGSIDGTVFDSSHAVVPSARITLTGLATAQARTVEADAQGRYFLTQIQPGAYRLDVEQQGFQKTTQNVTVETGRKLTVDVHLTVGATTDTVEVKSEAPLVEAGSATMGTLIGNKQVLDLPLAGRNPLRLAYLTPGITTTSTPGASSVTDVSGTSYISTAGSNVRQNEFYIDGVPNTIQDRVLYIPTSDAVQEFNIQTNPLDAEFGHGGGFYANLTTKSGTNQLHGTLFEFLQNDKLNANNFFLNRSGAKKAPLRYNQYGGTVGGPIVKDKTFWFFMHEGVRQRTGTSTITTVPTADQRNGDFSTTFPSLNQRVNIFDPFSTRRDPSTNALVRTQFPNNVIPGNRMDPVARNLVTMWPNANLPGVAQSGTSNYLFVGSAPLTTNAYVTRIDHTMGKHKLFGRFSVAKTLTLSPQVVDIGSVGGSGPTTGNNRVQTSIGLGDTFLISSTTFLTVQAGFARWTQEGLTPNYDLAKLGMPSSYTSGLQEQIFPTIAIGGYQGAGNEGNWFEHTNTFSFQATLNQVKGAHNLKYGFQLQPKRNNYQLAQRPSGTFAFSQAFTAGPDPNLRGAAVGQSLASFLLGAPDSGSANIRAAYSFQGNYYAGFIQDDWKLTSKLTLNLGLRYELQPNVTERYNRSVRGFDLTTPSPIEAAARANYARNPVPQLPVDQFRVLGGQIFATPDNRGNGGIVEKTMFVPRVGLAYRWNDRTVIRAGFGLFRSFWWQVSSATEGTGAETTTTMVNSRDGVTPADVLSNPFPQGLVQPTSTNAGLSTLVGSSISPFFYLKRFPYNNRWNLSVQRQVGRDLGVEVAYVGNTGFRLPVGTGGQEQNRQIHYLPAEYLGLGAQLNTAVPNPFFGVITTPGPLSQSTIPLSSLLSTYPQFTSVNMLRQTEGKSYYHSLQTSLTKRYARGVQIGATYTMSKLIEKLRYIDPTNAGPSKMIGEYDRPHRATFNMLWELPFAKNHGAVSYALGGWQLNAVFIYQSGGPIALGNLLPTSTSPYLDRSQQSVDRWYNTDAFRIFPAFTVRTLPNYLNTLRNDGQNNWDLSVLKTFPISRERVKLQFRFEMFNALNRVQFGNPTISPTAVTDGQIFSQANAPRMLQFGLKLLF
ncbi:MAG TPA: TonB-dependent receptor [Bryobacteraceae bacterium]|nr:TonB-dependent receptor [Bryobacteraceae bacterium]